MAKDWSKATPEELEARRAKQRAAYEANKEARKAKNLERYHNLPKEKKQYIVERAKNKRISQFLGEPGERYLDFLQADGTWIRNYNPDPEFYLFHKRKQVQMDARKAALQARMDRVTAWRREDPAYYDPELGPDWAGLYPMPKTQDRIKTTELFAKVLHIKGRRCKQCGCHNMWDFSWKITRADDLLAWQYFSDANLTAILKDPNAYDIYCIKCSWDLSLWAFSWIFSPYSHRNDPTRKLRTLEGTPYEGWDEIFQQMYPAGWDSITARIKSGAIKSLSCQVVGPKGHKIDTILRKKEWHGYVKFTTHNFHASTMQEVAALYMDNFPEMEYRMIGHNNIEEDITYVRRRKSLFMSEDLRQFLLNTPMGPHRNKDGTWRNLGTPVGARLPEVPAVEFPHADGLPPEEL